MILKYKEDNNIEESIVDITAKPNDIKISRILSIINENDDRILLTKENKTHLVDKQQIYYIEAVDNKTFIYTKADVYECELKLYEIIELLSTTFIRISKSIIVNLMYVNSIAPISGHKLILDLENTEKVVVNRSYVKDFKKKIKMR